MFQAQKLMAETQVASARFIPRRVPVLGTVAVLTFFTEPVQRCRGVSLAEILRPTSICIGVVPSPAPTFVLGAHLLTLKMPNARAVGPYPMGRWSWHAPAGIHTVHPVSGIDRLRYDKDCAGPQGDPGHGDAGLRRAITAQQPTLAMEMPTARRFTCSLIASVSCPPPIARAGK